MPYLFMLTKGKVKDTPLSQPIKNEPKIHKHYNKLLNIKSNIIEIIWYTFILVVLRTIINTYTLYYPQSSPPVST